MSQREKCPDCARGKAHWEGCSRVVCPRRKFWGAGHVREDLVNPANQSVGQGRFRYHAKGGESVEVGTEGTYIVPPKINDGH